MKCTFCNNNIKPGHRCKAMIEFNKKFFLQYQQEILDLYITQEYCVNDIANIMSKKLNVYIGRNVIDKILKYNNTNIRYATKTNRSKEKVRLTCIQKYGENIVNPSQAPIVKQKVKTTVQQKYGNDNVYKTQYFKDLMWIKSGKYYIEDQEEYKQFRMLVDNQLKKIKRTFVTSQSYQCYYTNVPIFLNIHYNDLHYLTIDHKYSVKDGYLNKWSIEQINDPSNLCICSRLCNIIKKDMSEEEFKNSEQYKRILIYENQANNIFK